MKVLIVGINPSSAKFKKNCTLDRLHRWMSFLGYTHYSFTNIISSTGSYNESLIDYSFLKESLNGYKKIIALGDLVSKTLNKMGVQHFSMPHPSPRNRKLNSSDYEKRMLINCRKYIQD